MRGLSSAQLPEGKAFSIGLTTVSSSQDGGSNHEMNREHTPEAADSFFNKNSVSIRISLTLRYSYKIP
jgi:hypothetical protein